VPRDVVKLLHDGNVLVASMCGKVRHAIAAVEADCDFVIAQGTEAGGHTGTVATMPLVPQIVDEVGARVPVVAAGGIFDGRGLAAAIALGADGVWIGTRFIATPEARTVRGYKEALLRTPEDGTVISRGFTGKTLVDLAQRFARLVRPTSPFVDAPAAPLASFSRNSSASRRAFFNSSCKRETVPLKSLREVLNPLLSSSTKTSASRNRSYASMPVIALIRRTPDAIDSSLVILNRPISPVARTCVPPQSSFEKIPSTPWIESTRTFSPYFSPKSAMAPERIASSTAISSVCTRSLRRMW